MVAASSRPARKDRVLEVVAIFIFFLTFVASFKSTAAPDPNDVSAVTLHPLVNLIKRYSYLGMIPVGICWLWVFVPPNRQKFAYGNLIFLMIVLRLLSFTRTMFVDIGSSLPEMFPVLVMLFLYYFANSCIHRAGYVVFRRGIGLGLVAYGIFFIACHIFLLVTGYGLMVSGERTLRMAGITPHPNFLGMQVAIFGIITFSYILEWWHHRMAALGLVLFLLAGIVIIYLTGSRNSFLMMGIGCLTVFWVRRGLKVNATALIVSALALTSIAYLGTAVPSLTDLAEGTPFDRGNGADNRGFVFAAMAGVIMEHPLFGTGLVLEGGENSYLRGWMAFGVFYFIGLAVYLYHAMRNIVLTRAIPTGALFVGLAFALIVGGFFDGQLIDRFSVVLIALALLGILSTPVPARRPVKRRPQAHTTLAAET